MQHSQLIRQPAPKNSASDGPAPGLVLIDTEVRIDADGRYCINDLHKAGGGAAKHQPANWLRLQQTQELAQEVERDAEQKIPHFRGIVSRQGVGTFVTKELVYAYAMWISPAFHLKVIRVFDAQAVDPQFKVPTTMAEALRLAADQAEQIERQQELIQKQAPQVEALHRIALQPTDRSMCITDAAKHLGVRPRAMMAWLMDHEWVYRRGEDGRTVGFQDRIDRGYLTHKLVEYGGSDGTPRQAAQVRVTQKGLAKLAHLIETGKGPK